MKFFLAIHLLFGALLVLSVCSCAEWAGNGVSVSATFEDPENHVKIEARTAK